MAAGRKVMVKLKRGRAGKGAQRELQRHIEEVLRAASPQGLEIAPLFPEDEDTELAALFEVSLPDPESVERAIACLETDEEVEYAHEPAERKPF